MQLNTSHYWMLVNVCPDLPCWGLGEVQLQCCHYCRLLLAQVSLHCALFHCTAALLVILPVLSYVTSPAPLLNSFILAMYPVLLYKMQTSHVAWNHLWQPDVTSCLSSFDWQVTCQTDSGHGVCVSVFVDLCEKSVPNMNFPEDICFSKMGKARILKLQDFLLEVHYSGKF